MAHRRRALMAHGRNIHDLNDKYDKPEPKVTMETCLAWENSAEGRWHHHAETEGEPSFCLSLRWKIGSLTEYRNGNCPHCRLVGPKGWWCIPCRRRFVSVRDGEGWPINPLFIAMLLKPTWKMTNNDVRNPIIQRDIVESFREVRERASLTNNDARAIRSTIREENCFRRHSYWQPSVYQILDESFPLEYPGGESQSSWTAFERRYAREVLGLILDHKWDVIVGFPLFETWLKEQVHWPHHKDWGLGEPFRQLWSTDGADPQPPA